MSGLRKNIPARSAPPLTTAAAAAEAKQQQEPERRVNLPPQTVGLQIPEIDVIGKELSENDGEIIAQPAVQQKQAGPHRLNTQNREGETIFLARSVFTHW